MVQQRKVFITTLMEWEKLYLFEIFSTESVWRMSTLVIRESERETETDGQADLLEREEFDPKL